METIKNLGGPHKDGGHEKGGSGKKACERRETGKKAQHDEGRLQLAEFHGKVQGASVEPYRSQR